MVEEQLFQKNIRRHKLKTEKNIKRIMHPDISQQVRRAIAKEKRLN